MSDRRLDKLFKDKLGERDFGYRDAYWTDFEKSFDIDSAISFGEGISHVISGTKILLIAVPVIVVTTFSVFVKHENLSTPENIAHQTTIQPVNKINPSSTNSVTSSKSDEPLQLHAEDFSNPDASTSPEAPATPEALNKNSDNPEVNPANKPGETDTENPVLNRIATPAFSDNSGPDPSTPIKNNAYANQETATGNEAQVRDESDLPEALIGNAATSGAYAASTAGKNNMLSDNDEPEQPSVTKTYIDPEADSDDFYAEQNAGRMDMLTLNSQSLDGSETQVDSTLKTRQSVLSAYRYRKFNPSFSLAANAGIAFVSKNLSSNLPEYSTMINQRNTFEQNKTAFTIGLEFETRYKGFSFTTGISRMSWGENVNYKSSPETLIVSDTAYFEITDNSYWEIIPIDSINFDSIYIIDIDTSIIQVTDTILYEPSDQLGRKNGKTSITYVEIPLLAGYEFYFKRLTLYVKGGVSVGFLTKTTGYYLNETTSDLIPVNTGYAVIRKTIWNLEMGLGLGYKFFPKFDVFLGSGFKMNLNSIFANPEVAQKYKAITLGLKLRYTF